MSKETELKIENTRLRGEIAELKELMQMAGLSPSQEGGTITISTVK